MRLSRYSGGLHASPKPAWLRARHAPLGGQPLLPPHCWLHRCVPKSPPRRAAAPVRAAADGWRPDDDSGPLAELRGKLQPLSQAFRQAVQALWEAQRRWLQHALARAALGLALLAAAATAATNLWAVPVLNQRLVPQVQAAATAMLQREVSLGAVRWVAPTGLAGLTPLASVGPVSVGAGPVEQSTAMLQRVTVGLDPLQSVLQQRLVLAVRAHGAQVDLAQAHNHSWFGFPEDTVPSARNFVPGAGGGGPAGGGGGSATGGTSSGAISSAAVPGNSSSSSTSAASNSSSEARKRMEALASRTASSSRQLQALMERLTQELAAAAVQPGGLQAAGTATADEQNPSVVLMGLGGAGSGQPQQTGSSDPAGTSSDLSFDQHQPPGGSSQEVARAAPGGGIFGGKLGWGRGPTASQQGPQAEPQPQQRQPPKQTRRQQQVAALNAMRLQAGRGYTLRQQGGAAAEAPAPASSTASQPTTGSRETAEAADSAVASSAEDNATASSSSSSNATAQAEPAAEQVESASQRSSAAVQPSEQQQQQLKQQHEPQHRKKRRKGAFAVQQQQQQREAAALAQPAAPAPAATEVARSGMSSISRVGSRAAALNEQLQPLRAPSGRLYSAGAAQQSLLQVASRTWQAAEADAAQAAMAEAETAAAVPAVPSMTPEQRKRAVAAINALPPIVVGQYQMPATVAAAAATAESASAAGEEAAATASEQEEAEGAVRAEGPAARRINALGTLQAPEELQPSVRVRRAAGQAFAAAVVDPATQRKKLGSAALPWSHQRQPATALIGSRLGGSNSGQAQHTAAAGSEAGAAAVQDGIVDDLAAGAAAGEGSYQLEGATGSDGEAAGKPATAAGSRRQPLLHPGYFTRARGPSYTPAPPEAILDARARRTTLGSFLRAALQAAVEQVGAPEVALGSIQLQGATVDAHVHGEALPRRFKDVSVSVRLGRDYDSLAVDLTAMPHERHPSATKCTMNAPHAHRHLRHVTGAAAVQTYQQNLAAAAAGDAAAAAAAEAAANGRPDSAALQAQAASAELTPDAAFAGRPLGGRVRIKVDASGIATGAVPQPGVESAPGVGVPSLDIRIRGEGLHAPIIERLIELPMDISAGRADGELRIYSHDAASWHFPEFYGRVAVRGAKFHFWDATDDITDADLDLVFEADSLYLHNARGAFGAVPMTLTGALGLNPAVGHYQLSASIPGVEVNALRATLGLRPTPQPVAGAVAGVLHVTGPLEKPVFSGTASAVRPTPTQLADCEPSEALAAVLAEPGAVGAFDRVPFSSAGAVFSLDTARETMQLHALHAELADGGQVHGTGRMWVAPRAEMDPSAVSIRAEGRDLAVEAVARRYMPEGVTPPPGMVVGRASLAATMQGSHMEPTLDVALQLPEASASCTAQLRRAAARLSLASPYADAAGTLHLAPPGFDAVKAAITQQAATALAQPNVTGLDADVSLRGLDVVPLVSDEQALRQLAMQSGQPLRLKLNGRARVSGTVSKAAAAAAAQAAPVSSSSGSGPSSSTAAPGAPGWVFSGDLGLESVRVNQLKLWQKLAGRLSVSSAGVSVHGKGLRANETLDLDLALPLFQQPAEQQQAEQDAALAAQAEQQAAVEQEVIEAPAANGEQQEGAADASDAEGQEGATLAEITPAIVLEPAATAVATQPPSQQPQQQPQRGGGGLQLRCGPLQVAADINAAGSQLDFKVAALKLDELELASLRGDLHEVSCSLNFDSHTGRGKLSLANPRYSGLRGESLSGGFRWERDVVRLEKLVLQQQKSRYEVQGEYSLPPNMPLPSSAADLALQPATGSTISSGPAAAGGRWRVQVSVPAAELQEIVPAARLLQSATSLSPAEYGRAKAAFLQAIDKASITAADLNTQLRAMAEQLQPEATTGGAGGGSRRADSPGQKDVGRGNGLQLPGLQDVRGQWGGSIQAYGGGGGATSCDFDVKGQTWQWGAYGLDALVANGNYHSEEGVALQEFVLKAGDAKLSVRGSLLGEHQDASLLLTDFPMTTLRPIFRAVPALQNAAPAVPAERPQPVASPRPLGMLTNVLGRATKGLQQGGDADSPINGLLYVSGNITGSRAQPTGEVAVRLYDAAVGPTRLSQAQASARLSEAQQLSFSVEVVPAEGHRQAGYVRAAGMVPLAEATASASSSVGASQQAPHHLHTAQAAAAQHLDVRLSVKDGGMAILTSVTPDVQWQGGQAAIDMRLRGSLEQPVLSGVASVSKATLDCPFLRFPLTNVSADVRAGDDRLTVEALEARCGRRGHIRVRGSLPVYGGSGSAAQQQSATGAAAAPQRLVADVSGLELRVRNMYSGQYDASLTVTNSLASPTVAGSMRFSKGIVFIVPQGAPDVASTASGSSGDTLLTPSGGAGASQQHGSSVAKVFDILTRGESGLAQQFEEVMKQEVEAVEHIVEDAGQHNVSLDGLAICLGPDLRAMYPLVMNFGVEGELGVSGPAHPDQVRVRGTLRLPSGDVNLVATQLALDREHANLITFQAEQGLDPVVDLVMTGGDLRVAIQGRASEWQDHLTLHYVSDKARPDSGEQLDAADAARIFEDKLKAALLAEDGQLALSRLAGTTVSTLMPKIETQGQVGGTRWRLVSAPSIPGLLSLDPSLADPSNILSSITMGTEVEIQFGKKLQAAMVRKLQESDVTTQWSLNYKLNSKLRMQFNITSAPPFPKTLMFQYSSEGNSS